MPYRTVALFFREVKEFREVREEVFPKLIELPKLSAPRTPQPPLINAGMLRGYPLSPALPSPPVSKFAESVSAGVLNKIYNMVARFNKIYIFA